MLRVIVQTDTPGAQVALQYFPPLVASNPDLSGVFLFGYIGATLYPNRRDPTAVARAMLSKRCEDLFQGWSFLMMGMDARSLGVPEGHVELAALAVARGVPPGKFIDGLGVERMAVARTHGTGSAVDHSRPVAAYLPRLLGLPQECRVFEVKHA